MQALPPHADTHTHTQTHTHAHTGEGRRWCLLLPPGGQVINGRPLPPPSSPHSHLALTYFVTYFSSLPPFSLPFLSSNASSAALLSFRIHTARHPGDRPPPARLAPTWPWCRVAPVCNFLSSAPQYVYLLWRSFSHSKRHLEPLTFICQVQHWPGSCWFVLSRRRLQGTSEKFGCTGMAAEGAESRP